VNLFNPVLGIIVILMPIWILLSHVGSTVGLPLNSLLNAWLIVGAIVCRLYKISIPSPNSNYLDLPGLLKVVWWLAWWPRYLNRRSK
jgi:hypothetical protein